MLNIKNNPFVSVVIPTIGRDEVLEKTIDFLLSQSYRPYEIIIVDQSNFSNAQKYNSKSGIIKYIHNQIRSLTNARNIGIKESKGDIILFLDDDIIPDNDLICYHVRGYKNSNVGCVAGRAIEKPDVLTNSKIAGCSINIFGRVLVNFTSGVRKKTYTAFGANMSFSKDAIEKTGFFDLRFSGSSQFEEADYCYRVRKKGYDILYEPDAIVKHLRAPTGGCRLDESHKIYYYRFHNMVLFYLKNMNKLFLPFAFTAHIFLAIKKVWIPSRNFSYFIETLKGLLDGYKSYRKDTQARPGFVSYFSNSKL